MSLSSCFVLYELDHSISYKIACAPTKTDQSDQSLLCPSEDVLDPRLPVEGYAKILIRLRGWQADLSFRWAHMQSCRKCCVPACMSFLYTVLLINLFSCLFFLNVYFHLLLYCFQ